MIRDDIIEAKKSRLIVKCRVSYLPKKLKNILSFSCKTFHTVYGEVGVTSSGFRWIIFTFYHVLKDLGEVDGQFSGLNDAISTATAYFPTSIRAFEKIILYIFYRFNHRLILANFWLITKKENR
jgi:hypothetical protein